MFSVIVPTLDRAHLLVGAVESILTQSFDDLEVVIVDDGSTDDTEAVVAKIPDPRVRLVRQERAGVAAARNRGVAESTGRLVTFLDTDDRARTEWLERLAEALCREEVGAATCGAVFVAHSGEVVDVRVTQDTGLPNHGLGVFLAGTFALRREIFEALGGYVSELRHSENTELALRLVRHCERYGWAVRSLPEPLVDVHVSLGGRDYSEARLAAIRYLLERHGPTLASRPVVLGDYLCIAGVCAARMGRYREARHWFLAAIRACPGRRKAYGRFLLSLVPPAGERVWGRSDSADRAIEAVAR